MCVKLPSENLNPSSYPPHLANTYTCGIITTLRMRCGINQRTYCAHKVGLGLGPVDPMHYTQSDGNMCLKVNICHHLNESNTTGH